MDVVVTYTLFGLGICMLVCSGLQLIQKNKTDINYLMALLFLSMGQILGYGWLFRSGILSQVPGLMYSDIGVTAFLGPIAYSYTKRITGDTITYSAGYFMRYLPAALIICFFIAYHPLADLYREGEGALYPGGQNIDSVIFFVSLFADIWLLGHLAVSAKMVFALTRKEEFASDRTLYKILLFYCISIGTYPLFIMSYMFRNEYFIGIGLIINGYNFLYYFLLSYRYPDYTQAPFVKEKKEKQSSLRGVDITGSLHKIQCLFEDEKVFRQPDMTIYSLSGRLELKPYQLSEIINEKMGMKFRDLLNAYRIREAQRLLVEEPDKSIIEIAFDVGFNSKSSFHAVFIKETGVTPMQFRKERRECFPEDGPH